MWGTFNFIPLEFSIEAKSYGSTESLFRKLKFPASNNAK